MVDADKAKTNVNAREDVTENDRVEDVQEKAPDAKDVRTGMHDKEFIPSEVVGADMKEGRPKAHLDIPTGGEDEYQDETGTKHTGKAAKRLSAEYRKDDEE